MTAGRQPAVPDPRLAAFRILADTRTGEFADRSAVRRLSGLTGKDRALAQELAYGAIRLRARLDAELDCLTFRPLASFEPRVVDWLRLGLYQLRELRIPDHAAVHETVQRVRRVLGRRPAGLVNAVLRRAARQGQPPDAFPSPADDPVGYLTTYGSHPEWLVRRWLGRWPLASVIRLVENDNRVPEVTVRLLSDGPEAPHVYSLAPGVRLDALPPWRAVFRLAEGRPEQVLGRLRAVIQDPAASAVVDYVGDGICGPVLDACAGPGGKTVALAALASRARPFVASDLSPDRLRLVEVAVARTGVRVHPVVMDGRSPALASARTVFLDVPCTGTGVLRRRPDSRWRVSPARLESLVALQRELLDACAELVAPGGLLVYATCSLEPDENDEQVEGFLARYPEFSRDMEAVSDAVPADLLRENGDLQVLPWTRGTDGAFACRLRRRGST